MSPLVLIAIAGLAMLALSGKKKPPSSGTSEPAAPAPGQQTGTPPILPQQPGPTPAPFPGLPSGLPSLGDIGGLIGGLIPKPGQPPPFFPSGTQTQKPSTDPLPDVALLPCLDDNLTAEERQDAINIIQTSYEGDSGVHSDEEHGHHSREDEAAFLDKVAADAANSGHPQFAFCMLAKAANIRAGGDGLPHLDEDGALKF